MGGGKATTEFFGSEVKSSHVFSHQFHERAHYFPHATPSSSDLRRAKQPKPGRAFTGSSFAESMSVLNSVLRRVPSLATKNCSAFSSTELHATQQVLFNARTPALDKVYSQASDTRRMAHRDRLALQAEHVKHAA